MHLVRQRAHAPSWGRAVALAGSVYLCWQSRVMPCTTGLSRLIIVFNLVKQDSSYTLYDMQQGENCSDTIIRVPLMLCHRGKFALASPSLLRQEAPLTDAQRHRLSFLFLASAAAVLLVNIQCVCMQHVCACQEHRMNIL